MWAGVGRGDGVGERSKRKGCEEEDEGRKEKRRVVLSAEKTVREGKDIEKKKPKLQRAERLLHL